MATLNGRRIHNNVSALDNYVLAVLTDTGNPC